MVFGSLATFWPLLIYILAYFLARCLLVFTNMHEYNTFLSHTIANSLLIISASIVFLLFYRFLPRHVFSFTATTHPPFFQQHFLFISCAIMIRKRRGDFYHRGMERVTNYADTNRTKPNDQLPKADGPTVNPMDAMWKHASAKQRSGTTEGRTKLQMVSFDPLTFPGSICKKMNLNYSHRDSIYSR